MSTGTSSVTTLDNYFSSHQPAIKLAGVRRTTRPSKPSARVRDAINSLSDSAVTRKRKGSNISLNRRVARKTIPDSDSSDVSVMDLSLHSRMPLTLMGLRMVILDIYLCCIYSVIWQIYGPVHGSDLSEPRPNPFEPVL
jgi:hypothetical protein